MSESEEELKSLLMKVKEENEKVDLKHNIQKTKIMASSCINSWQIDDETVETVTGFIFLGSKIIVDSDFSHEIKKRLLLGKKIYGELNILKNRDITLKTKVHVVKPMGISKIPWRREWQPTPVFLPGEFHGQRSLAGYCPWGCKESDMTE